MTGYELTKVEHKLKELLKTQEYQINTWPPNEEDSPGRITVEFVDLYGKP